jgi:hypothetical protein
VTSLVCGTDNPVAFAKLRDLLMMHFAIHKKWAAEMGEPQVVAIENYVIERLRKSLPEADGTMDTPTISVISGLVGTLSAARPPSPRPGSRSGRSTSAS